MNSCKNNTADSLTEEEVNDLYNHSQWIRDMDIALDSTIDKRLFIEQSQKNPASWAAALKFMREISGDNVSPGKYPLLDDGTYATVSDYITKDSSRFEAHRKYIDLQYVSRGQEYIFLASVNGEKTIISAYDEKKDIEFFKKDTLGRRLADRNRFFIFFPQNAHMPCIKVNRPDSVRKIVVKIPYKE